MLSNTHIKISVKNIHQVQGDTERRELLIF